MKRLLRTLWYFFSPGIEDVVTGNYMEKQRRMRKLLGTEEQ